MPLFHRVLTHPWLFLIPIIVAVVSIASIVATLFQWSAKQVDPASSHKQETIVSAALDRAMQRIAKDQEAATVWDDAILHLSPPDFEWLDANLGIWMHTYYGHDRTYILDSANRPVYAMADGSRVEPGSYVAAEAVSAPLVTELRKQLAASAQPEAEDVLSPGAIDLAVIGGHPAIVSAKPIVSDTGKIKQVPGKEPIHISILYLDCDFVRRLSNAYLLDSARFSWNDDRGSTEMSIPYRSRNGAAIGHLIWSPFLPGSSVRSSMQPALV